jgi:RimJ/RimL family protein N-acetyltransferase
MIKIETLELEDLEKVRKWRADIMETLRTPYMLTKKMQEDYYNNVISKHHSNTRYWKFMDSFKFVGSGGVENIEWENKRGEISLIINPEFRMQGYGKRIIDIIIDKAFNYLNLEFIWGECYCCGAIGFWEKIIIRKKAFKTILPNRKYYKGNYWNSLYFEFRKGRGNG